MERTWKSLQISRQHWIANKNLSKEIKDKIDEIYFSEENREKKTPEEIFQEIIHIKIGKCEICGHDIFLGMSCPGIYNNKLPENPNIYQKKHYEYRCNNIKVAAQNRDNSYLIERNKTQKMRESSRKVGLITGSKNIRKAHELNTGLKFCNKCQKETSHLLGVGCLTCHNSSKVMKDATTKRNIENWKNPEYAKKIASNLGEFCIPNFIIKNNVRYYKDKELNKLCDDFFI